MKNEVLGLIFVCAFAFAANAYTGAQYLWTGGGDATTLNDGANWNKSGATPGATDAAQFNTSGTLNLTANADFLAGCGSFQPKNGPLTVNLDLGDYRWKGNAPSSQWAYRFVAGGTAAYPLTVNFTGGVITNVTSLSVGRSHDGNYYGSLNNTAFNISGAGTVFWANYDTTGVGYSGTNNVLTVSDGAFFRSGREIQIGNGAAASNNLLRVTGAGSAMEMRPDGNSSYIGNGGSFNELLFEENATATKSNVGDTYLGNGAGAHGNRVTILSGASAVFSDKNGNGTLSVGNGGSDDNVLVVSNGSFQAIALLIGCSASGTDAACGNKAYFGDAAQGTVGNHLTVGSAALCDSNELHVAGAGTVLRTTNYDIGLGVRGWGNRVFVSDGATLQANRSVSVGCTGDYNGATCGTGCGNVLNVAGKGSLLLSRGNSVGYFQLGGTNNTVAAADGGCVCVGTHARIGAGAGSWSNCVSIADARLVVSNQMLVGGWERSSFNRVDIAGQDASAYFRCGLTIGGGAGANSNLVFIADGAVVTNAVYTTWDCKARVGYNAAAVGNRMVVSNATFYTGTKEELVVNGLGRGNVLEAIDGAKVIVGQSFRCGSDASSCYGLIRAAGEGSVLTNTQYHLYVDGHHNGVSIEDGAKMYIKNAMVIGSSGAAHTNNFLRIANGGFFNYGSDALELYNDAKLIWEGSRSKMRVSTLKVDGELEFVADEDGLADFGPVYETYLLNNDWTPRVKKITVDVRKYLENNRAGTFTILRSGDNRTCRTAGGTDLKTQSAETIAAVNKAFADRIEFIPEGCGKVESVDMTKSKIVVSVKKQMGLMLIVR